ncbi:hypothetical protein INR49_026339 [Caranx melampygus]|nr:hypothetical protein INR49_026339 [Caranx melampygus]
MSAILRLAEQGGGEICGCLRASTGTAVQPSTQSAPNHRISSGQSGEVPALPAVSLSAVAVIHPDDCRLKECRAALSLV